MKKVIPYGRQSIDQDDVKEVVKVLQSDFLTQGPKVEEFEKAVAKYCGVKYAVATSSGTSALHLAYFAAGLGQGDEVITTPLTFAATSNMLVVLGVKPVFVDIKEGSLVIDPDLIKRKINKKTKAIVGVDFAGHPFDLKKVLLIAKNHGLLVIEDACHSLGAEYLWKKQWKKVGSLADMTVLSFHPVKHITTGEGGMILTNSKKFYLKLKTFRNHGMVKKPKKGAWYYEIKKPFFNYRVTDIQCALGLSQLKKLEGFIKRRRQIANIYQEAFQNNKEITIPLEASNVRSSWHIYPIGVKNKERRRVFNGLRKEGVLVQVHYMPLHLHPFYKNEFGYKKGDFPVAEKYYEGALTLPLFPKMSESDIQYVISKVKKYVR